MKMVESMTSTEEIGWVMKNILPAGLSEPQNVVLSTSVFLLGHTSYNGGNSEAAG